MSFSVAEEKDFVRITLSGTLTRQDLIGLASAAEELERGRERVPHRLADMRGVTEMQVAYPEIQAFADTRRTRRFPNAFKSAILVGSSVQSGMARMFRTINDNPQISVEIFEDEAEALRWLGE